MNDTIGRLRENELVIQRGPFMLNSGKVYTENTTSNHLYNSRYFQLQMQIHWNNMTNNERKVVNLTNFIVSSYVCPSSVHNLMRYPKTIAGDEKNYHLWSQPGTCIANSIQTVPGNHSCDIYGNVTIYGECLCNEGFEAVENLTQCQRE